MSISAGMNLIDRFNDDAEVFVFLISTLAGGTGLNLTAANKVVIFGNSSLLQFEPACSNLELIKTRTGVSSSQRTLVRLSFDQAGLPSYAQTLHMIYKLWTERIGSVRPVMCTSIDYSAQALWKSSSMLDKSINSNS